MKFDVAKVAKLANLTLSDSEKTKLEGQLSSILEYVEKLNEVDTENVEETSQVTGLENVLREDELGNCAISQEEALSGTDSKEKGQFKVKAVLESV